MTNKKIVCGLVVIVGFITAFVIAAPFEDLNLNKWSINGSNVSATATQINKLTSGFTGSITNGTGTVTTNITVVVNGVITGNTKTP